MIVKYLNGKSQLTPIQTLYMLTYMLQCKNSRQQKNK